MTSARRDSPSMARLATNAERVRRKWNETGLMGVGRQAARHALLKVADTAVLGAERLLDREELERLDPQQRALLARNRSFRQMHAGEAAFVLATGPSLNGMDLEPLRHRLTFGMNSLFRHPIIDTGWQPRVYSFLDDAYFAPNQFSDDFHADIKSRLRDTTFFAPVKFARIVRERGWLAGEVTNHHAVGGTVTDHTPLDIELDAIIPSMQNVLVLSLAIAVWMGCSPIYILGADHNFLTTPIAARGYDIPHFHGGPSIDRGEAVKQALSPGYLDVMHYCERVWRAHRFVHAVARKRGIEIFNCTPASFLDVYPHRDYAEALRG